MTLFRPAIIVERMRIECNGRPVYDESFHSGVNVIRGDNSSGKSTILNFIFYGLGGDLADWSKAALRCSRVLLQAKINDDVATLSREVAPRSRMPMDIYAGEIDEALKAPVGKWLRFGYTRSESRESFSQALFRLMGIPEAATDISGSMTINQILRLLYADQLSPIESLFKYQGTFDNGDIRDAVGRLLFGAHSIKFYENEQKIRQLEKELDQIVGEYRSLMSIAADQGRAFTLEFVLAERARLEARSEELADQIAAAERDLSLAATDEPTLRAQEKAYAEVVAAQALLADLQRERDVLAMKIGDSDRFLSALRHKLQDLRDSSMVADVIGKVRFSECPACHALVSDLDISHACYLCKQPFEEGHERGRITGLINETALQIQQSERLQAARSGRASELDAEIARCVSDWRMASSKFAEIKRSPTTEKHLRLRELVRESGYISRETEELGRREKIAHRLRLLMDRRENIGAEIEKLRSENEALEREQQERLQLAATAASDEIKALLRNDLRRQDAFANPNSIQFSFRDNRIAVDDQQYFSASSRAILKSSFVLGLLAAAARLPFMRHPRICIIDTLENMGVEAVRSQNFQQQILRVSEGARADHQIVYATATISEQLDREEYTVGRHYTLDAPSLAF